MSSFTNPTASSSSSSSAVPPSQTTSVPMSIDTSIASLSRQADGNTNQTPTPQPPTMQNVQELLKSIDVQSSVLTIMKRILPSHMIVDQTALDLVTDCMLEFASAVSFEAVGAAGQESRKTIIGKDFETAVRVLGFEEYAEPISEYDNKRERHIIKDKCVNCSGKYEQVGNHHSSSSSNNNMHANKKPNKKRSHSRKIKGEVTINAATAPDTSTGATGVEEVAPDSTKSSSKHNNIII